MHQFQHDTSTALVTTAKGKIQGYRHDGLSIFKGIPYAKAARFHAPQPLEPWEGVLDACSYGYVCPLLSNDAPRGELYVPHRFWPMDENCQNLNIWTPDTDEAKRPVLVWLHGGGFSAGSAIEHIAYDGAAMSRMGNVVVVTINHRLNVLGYFDLSDFGEEYENSGNAGGDDIIAALAWIHENIQHFGGDPENVTVFGQSGGGAKVTTLLQSPAADGLYHKGIVMSGVIGPVLADAQGSGKELAEAVMQELGVQTVQELETVDYAALARAYLKVSPQLKAEGKYTGNCPHPNKHYVGEPVRNGFRPETSQVPLMVGSVFGEFTSFSPLPWPREGLSEEEQAEIIRKSWGEEPAEKLIPLFRAAYPDRPLTDLLRLDFIFRLPEIDYIAERSKLNQCTWSYLFNMDQPIDGGNTPWHCSDIPYVFHNIDLVEYPHGPQAEEGLSEKIQEQVFQAVIAFARTGNPACSQIPAWPASTAERENVLVVDGNTRVLTNYDHELIRTLGVYAETITRKMREAAGQIQH
ncbi:MAG: carboxylesterase/lipase family protein [Clostridia bacterium]|nr:carboxylesterase/lipase family protein [Clostridia bacterium]